VTAICGSAESECVLLENTHAKVQKDKMRKVVQSLGSLMGDRNPSLIVKLEHTVESMDGSNMEKLAENMVGMAVLQTNLDAVKANTPPSLALSLTSG
jgi:uncharacterized protein involved in tellurium resistance